MGLVVGVEKVYTCKYSLVNQAFIITEQSTMSMKGYEFEFVGLQTVVFGGGGGLFGIGVKPWSATL